jgi:hypothetical protein
MRHNWLLRRGFEGERRVLSSVSCVTLRYVRLFTRVGFLHQVNLVRSIEQLEDLQSERQEFSPGTGPLLQRWPEQSRYRCQTASQLRASDLFKRGWTLQELVAPENVVFVVRSERFSAISMF